MSDTPRTDKFAMECEEFGYAVVDAAVARELEREIASLRGQLSLAKHHANGRWGDYERALEERDELRVENAKLREWIKRNGEMTDTCTHDILGTICDGCGCKRAPHVSAKHPKT